MRRRRGERPERRDGPVGYDAELQCFTAVHESCGADQRPLRAGRRPNSPHFRGDGCKKYFGRPTCRGWLDCGHPNETERRPRSSVSCNRVAGQEYRRRVIALAGTCREYLVAIPPSYSPAASNSVHDHPSRTWTLSVLSMSFSPSGTPLIRFSHPLLLHWRLSEERAR